MTGKEYSSKSLIDLNRTFIAIPMLQHYFFISCVCVPQCRLNHIKWYNVSADVWLSQGKKQLKIIRIVLSTTISIILQNTIIFQQLTEIAFFVLRCSNGFWIHSTAQTLKMINAPATSWVTGLLLWLHTINLLPLHTSTHSSHSFSKWPIRTQKPSYLRGKKKKQM